MSEIQEKIREHWEYVKEVIRDGRDDDEIVYLTIQDYLTIIGYHYRTAMEHGWKHGKEEIK